MYDPFDDHEWLPEWIRVDKKHPFYPLKVGCFFAGGIGLLLYLMYELVVALIQRFL